YLVECRWFKQWKKFVGFDQTSDPFCAGEELNNPGAIDNSSLFKADGCTLKDHLIDELDYNLLPKDAWFKLVLWYGVTSDQQALPRKVVEHGVYVKSCKVEVYLMEFRLSQHSDPQTLVTRQFSRGDTIGHIMSEMRKVFNIAEKAETRLWTNYMSATYELLSNLEHTVLDAGFITDRCSRIIKSVLIIEQKNKDVAWQSQARQRLLARDVALGKKLCLYRSVLQLNTVMLLEILVL
ncbi:Ubiquitin carboxyl-terminal hydrolase 15, partial [Desmophyllum pertusum]